MCVWSKIEIRSGKFINHFCFVFCNQVGKREERIVLLADFSPLIIFEAGSICISIGKCSMIFFVFQEGEESYPGIVLIKKDFFYLKGIYLWVFFSWRSERAKKKDGFEDTVFFLGFLYNFILFESESRKGAQCWMNWYDTIHFGYSTFKKVYIFLLFGSSYCYFIGVFYTWASAFVIIII